MRMKEWVTVDVKKVVETVNRFGYLKVLDERDLVVDVETEEDYENLNKELEKEFKDQLNLERV
jgi:GTP:adenosylcobinamide-phosphate guanylyltransferase